MGSTTSIEPLGVLPIGGSAVVPLKATGGAVSLALLPSDFEERQALQSFPRGCSSMSVKVWAEYSGGGIIPSRCLHGRSLLYNDHIGTLLGLAALYGIGARRQVVMRHDTRRNPVVPPVREIHSTPIERPGE